MENLNTLLEEKQISKIYQNFTIDRVVRVLSFYDSMKLAYLMFTTESNDQLFRYSADLLQKIRLTFPDEWEADWKNDVFLGDVCQFTEQEDESYKAYLRAFKKIKSNPPASLLVSLAGCYTLSGKPISMLESENLIKQALKSEKSIEAVAIIRGICKTQNRDEEFAYWDKLFQELRDKGAYMKIDRPEYLKDT